jgi:hypothetical protein
MEAKEIYLKIKREITKGLYAYDDQIVAIAEWVESEFEPKKQGGKLPIHDVSNSAEYTRGYKDGWRDCCKDVKEFG